MHLFVNVRKFTFMECYVNAMECYGILCVAMSMVNILYEGTATQVCICSALHNIKHARTVPDPTKVIQNYKEPNVWLSR